MRHLPCSCQALCCFFPDSRVQRLSSTCSRSLPIEVLAASTAAGWPLRLPPGTPAKQVSFTAAAERLHFSCARRSCDHSRCGWPSEPTCREQIHPACKVPTRNWRASDEGATSLFPDQPPSLSCSFTCLHMQNALLKGLQAGARSTHTCHLSRLPSVSTSRLSCREPGFEAMCRLTAGSDDGAGPEAAAPPQGRKRPRIPACRQVPICSRRRQILSARS